MLIFFFLLAFSWYDFFFWWKLFLGLWNMLNWRKFTWNIWITENGSTSTITKEMVKNWFETLSEFDFYQKNFFCFRRIVGLLKIRTNLRYKIDSPPHKLIPVEQMFPWYIFTKWLFTTKNEFKLFFGFSSLMIKIDKFKKSSVFTWLQFLEKFNWFEKLPKKKKNFNFQQSVTHLRINCENVIKISMRLLEMFFASGHLLKYMIRMDDVVSYIYKKCSPLRKVNACLLEMYPIGSFICLITHKI